MTSLSAGIGYTCAVDANHIAYCWGRNLYGHLGDGSATADSASHEITSFSDDGLLAADISAGENHTCALLSDDSDGSFDSVQCWGEGGEKIGSTSVDPSPAPVAVEGFYADNPPVDIEAGRSHNCAILTDGTVGCWGDGESGSLGNGNVISSAGIVAVSVIDGSADSLTAKKICAGSAFSCALMNDGSAMCWGDGFFGQLGDQYSPGMETSIPVGVDFPARVEGATDIACGDAHACALMKNGSMMCWGLNSSGQIGDSTTSDKSVPTLVPLIDGGSEANSAVKISAGKSFSCAIMEDGSGKCWGDGTDGKLGTGGTNDETIPAVILYYDSGGNSESSLSNPIDIESGWSNTGCAIMGDGSVKCWGSNSYGETGTTMRDVSSSLAIDTDEFDGTDVVSQVVIGSVHACVRMDDGMVSCFGSNELGQVGEGLSIAEDYFTPVPVKFN